MKRSSLLIALAIFALSFGLRAWKIGADLPHIYQPDEPHHLNIAVRFGSGDLNPHDFKYPTVWPYLLAGAFGVLFVARLLSGLTHSAQEFAILYLTNPTAFYLTARMLAAALTALASVVLFRIGEKYYTRSFAVSIALLSTLSPTILVYGRDATHYGPLLFFISLALYQLHQTLENNSRYRDWILSGFLIGLTLSVHYVAAPLCVILLPIFWALPSAKKSWKSLAAGYATVGVGFLVGSPFIPVEWRRFYSDIHGIGELQQGAYWHSSQFSVERTLVLLKNLFQFIDSTGAGFILVILGTWVSFQKKEKRIFPWIFPTLITLPVLCLLYFGNLQRYALAIYFPLFIPAAYGFFWLWEKSRHKIWRVALLGIFIPSLILAAQQLPERSLPDTRTQAHDWIMAHVPYGEKIFITDPYNAPQFPMAPAQIQRLLKRTTELNHPRKEYFRLLSLAPQNESYELYYLRRSDQDVQDIPHRTQTAYQAQDTIDVKSTGIDEFQRQGIRTIVIKAGVESEANLEWIQQLKTRYHLAASFIPEHGHTKGIPVEIYRAQ